MSERRNSTERALLGGVMALLASSLIGAGLWFGSGLGKDWLYAYLAGAAVTAAIGAAVHREIGD